MIRGFHNIMVCIISSLRFLILDNITFPVELFSFPKTNLWRRLLGLHEGPPQEEQGAGYLFVFGMLYRISCFSVL